MFDNFVYKAYTALEFSNRIMCKKKMYMALSKSKSELDSRKVELQ